MTEIRARLRRDLPALREGNRLLPAYPDKRAETEVTGEEREALWDKLYDNKEFCRMCKGQIREFLMDASQSLVRDQSAKTRAR